MLTLWFLLACAGAPAPEALEVPGHSLYALDVSLETSTGERVGLDAARGPTRVAFFYPACTGVCPMTVGSIQALQAGLPAEVRADLRIVSLDPDRDDPGALEAMRERRGLDASWMLARASDEQVRELAAALGTKYRPLADGEIAHGAQVMLLDASGVVRSRVDLGSEPANGLRAALAAV